MIRGPRVGILTPQHKQAPFLEYDSRTCRWRVWLSYDPTVDGGTYLDLWSNGGCDRVTQLTSGMIDTITSITGPVS